jgi:Aspartyl protease
MVGALAIVDSGADSCVFPASLAAQLGIAIPNSNASIFSGTANAPQIAYYETIKVGVWDRSNVNNPIPIQFDLYAGFCETLEHVGLGLLGQAGFFSQFLVRFDHDNQFFDVEAKPPAPPNQV